MFQFLKSPHLIRVADILIVVITIGAIGFGVMRHQANSALEACRKVGTVHELKIQHGAFSDDKISVRRCDTVKVINLDKDSYWLAFGTQKKHIDYPGFESQLLGTGESLDIDTFTTGTYRLHDHLRDKAVTELTVVPFKG